MQANEKQQIAIDGITDWVIDEGAGWASVLEGPAGTGKTFTVARIIESVRKINPSIRIALIAPTHKAKKAAIDALERSGVRPESLSFIGTVASAIGRRGDNTDAPDERGKSKFRLMGNTPLGVSECDMLLIDEMSMLDQTDVKGIKGIRERNMEIKCLFTGDFAQLRPVSGASIKPILDKCKRRYALSEIMRTKNKIDAEKGGKSAIDDLANTLRTTDRIKWGAFEASNIRLIRDARDWRLRFVKSDDTVAIAFRNIVVDSLNAVKRERIFGAKVPALVEGETLLVTEQPVVHMGDPWAHISDEIKIVSIDGEEVVTVPWSKATVKTRVCTIQDAEQAVIERPVLLGSEIGNKSPFRQMMDDCRKVPLEMDALRKEFGGGYVSIPLSDISWRTQKYLAGDEDVFFTTRSAQIPNMNRWVGKAWAQAYFGVANMFAVMQHRWAITAHKSQGSTFRSVAIHVPDLDKIASAEDRRAAKYVAVSRASEEVSVLL